MCYHNLSAKQGPDLRAGGVKSKSISNLSSFICLEEQLSISCFFNTDKPNWGRIGDFWGWEEGKRESASPPKGKRENSAGPKGKGKTGNIFWDPIPLGNQTARTHARKKRNDFLVEHPPTSDEFYHVRTNLNDIFRIHRSSGREGGRVQGWESEC